MKHVRDIIQYCVANHTSNDNIMLINSNIVSIVLFLEEQGIEFDIFPEDEHFFTKLSNNNTILEKIKIIFNNSNISLVIQTNQQITRNNFCQITLFVNNQIHNLPIFDKYKDLHVWTSQTPIITLDDLSTDYINKYHVSIGDYIPSESYHNRIANFDEFCDHITIFHKIFTDRNFSDFSAE